MKTLSNRGRKQRIRATLLIEVAAGFGALLIVSLLLLKASVNVVAIKQWTVIQSLSDAYMSREVAIAKRYPFEDFLSGAGSTQWPTVVSSTPDIVLGRLPGGRNVTGVLYRVRVADANNLFVDGDAVSNPTGTETWKLQSYLAYSIGGRNYVKSRTVIRSR